MAGARDIMKEIGENIIMSKTLRNVPFGIGLQLIGGKSTFPWRELCNEGLEEFIAAFSDVKAVSHMPNGLTVINDLDFYICNSTHTIDPTYYALTDLFTEQSLNDAKNSGEDPWFLKPRSDLNAGIMIIDLYDEADYKDSFKKIKIMKDLLERLCKTVVKLDVSEYNNLSEYGIYEEVLNNFGFVNHWDKVDDLIGVQLNSQMKFWDTFSKTSFEAIKNIILTEKQDADQRKLEKANATFNKDALPF